MRRSSVGRTVQSTVLKTMPRYVKVWDGVREHLSGWSTNPRERARVVSEVVCSFDRVREGARTSQSSRKTCSRIPLCLATITTSLITRVNSHGARERKDSMKDTGVSILLCCFFRKLLSTERSNTGRNPLEDFGTTNKRPENPGGLGSTSSIACFCRSEETSC